MSFKPFQDSIKKWDSLLAYITERDSFIQRWISNGMLRGKAESQWILELAPVKTTEAILNYGLIERQNVRRVAKHQPQKPRKFRRPLKRRF